MQEKLAALAKNSEEAEARLRSGLESEIAERESEAKVSKSLLFLNLTLNSKFD